MALVFNEVLYGVGLVAEWKWTRQVPGSSPGTSPNPRCFCWITFWRCSYVLPRPQTRPPVDFHRKNKNKTGSCFGVLDVGPLLNLQSEIGSCGLRESRKSQKSERNQLPLEGIPCSVRQPDLHNGSCMCLRVALSRQF